MTVYKNLDTLRFQVVDLGAKTDTKNLYRYYFVSKESDLIGIPLPDHLSKIKENYSEKYLETLICQVFDEHAPFYRMVENFYIEVILTKKEQKSLSKALQEEYAKPVNDIIRDTSEQIVQIFEQDNDLFIRFTDPHFDRMNTGGKFDTNIRFNEYSFLASIHNFKPYNEDIFFCSDSTMTKEEAYEGFANLGFKTYLSNVKK